MGSPENPMDVEMGDISEDAKLNPKDAEVKTEQKLLTGNGETTESRFTGLKKEELLEISSQPKWKRARWILFIIFWLVWIAMLVGAILIVVKAPRCKPEPKPQWYQDTIVYAASVEEFGRGFEGMKKHIPYLSDTDSLQAKTLLATFISDENNPEAVINNDEEGFKSLVSALHKKGMKILADLVVDTMAVTSMKFRQSASAACHDDASAAGCDFFIWKAIDSTEPAGPGSQWVPDDTRNESYKAPESNPSLAFINYASADAFPYITGVLASWFNRSIDGVQIRDVARLQNITGREFVQTLFDQNFMNATDPARALFVYSSTPDASINPVPLSANDTNTDPAPVFLNNQIPDGVGKDGAGDMIKNAILDWRKQSRHIGGYVISPLGEGLAGVRFPQYAPGLNLLSLALPGVPVLRSGDELNATSAEFEWSKADPRDSVPLNGSQAVLKQSKTLTVLRVAGLQAMQSLRFDTRNGDTTFEFLDLGNSDVVAFKRKWDQKPAVLVVSNLSPNEHTLNLRVKGGLMADEELVKKAEVIVASIEKADTDNMEAVKLPPGATLILK